MRDYRKDIRVGDKWEFEQDCGEPYVMLEVKQIKMVPPYGECVFWDDGSWMKIKELKDGGKPLGNDVLGFNKEEVKKAVKGYLDWQKGLGATIDSDSLVNILSEYAFELAYSSYRKGKENVDVH